MISLRCMGHQQHASTHYFFEKYFDVFFKNIFNARTGPVPSPADLKLRCDKQHLSTSTLTHPPSNMPPPPPIASVADQYFTS